MGKRNKGRKGIVYSTDPDYDYTYDDEIEAESLEPRQQNLRISRQRLKGNKQVTRIENFLGSELERAQLAKHLKTFCGCGGTVKDEIILIQGDFIEKIKGELTRLGYKFKQVGG
ncbi:MAG: translation initiation factor [Bacteroidota bacterium]